MVCTRVGARALEWEEEGEQSLNLKGEQPVYKGGLRRGRGTTIGLRRGRGTTNGLGSQITEDTGVECQFQATMVCTRGGGTAFLGRGGRIQWRGHEANVPSNYAQATQSSQTAVGSNKSTTKCIFKGQKFGNLAAI